ncbi:MAG: 2-amino-4-hydroxy-6-hydroxymethyldihydropteridine diphosphokinase [Chloroflexota bacterium]
MPKTRAYISMGTNFHPDVNLERGVQGLAKSADLIAVSPVYSSPAEKTADDSVPDYWNAAVIVETARDARSFKFDVLKAIESEAGRDRENKHQVALDLDLIFFGNEVMDAQGMVLPENDVLLYRFVAQPLADIAPNFEHPITGNTLAHIAERLKSTGQILTRRDDVALPQP